MNYKKLLVAFGLAVAVTAMAAPAQAQVRARGAVVVGRAVPRVGPGPFFVRPGIVGVAPYRPYFRPGLSLAVNYGYPYYGRYVGYSAYGYPYGYAYPYPSIGLGYAVRGPVGAFGRARIALPARRVGRR
jgi:hypothetical protein